MSGTTATQGYVSDIPIARPTLGHAVLSEWTKVRTVRSTVWSLIATVVVTVGIGMLLASNTDDGDYSFQPFTLPGLMGIMLGQVGVITLGVLMVASEHGTGLIRTTFTAAPDRYRVLTAKYLVFAVLAFTVVLGSVTLVTLMTMVLHAGPGAGPHAFGRAVSGLVGGSAYVTLLGLLGLAVGALLRHSVGAVTTMLGALALPAIMPTFLFIWERTLHVGQLLLSYSAPVGLASVFGMPATELDGPQSGLPQLLVLAGITAAAVFASYRSVAARDV
ncbi:ABC transporter permease [Streptomyces sp. NPDC093225]|uniref:ABC transporter permease n=1 Tax=Streptomyces sp. NPDC093225 TaxID=3366034 RepID=UPI00381EDE10